MQQEKERRERAERERIERERERQNRDKQISAVDAVDHHFQLSMELAKKVSDLLQCHFKFEHNFQGDSPRNAPWQNANAGIIILTFWLC